MRGMPPRLVCTRATHTLLDYPPGGVNVFRVPSSQVLPPPPLSLSLVIALLLLLSVLLYLTPPPLSLSLLSLAAPRATTHNTQQHTIYTD